MAAGRGNCSKLRASRRWRHIDGTVPRCLSFASLNVTLEFPSTRFPAMAVPKRKHSNSRTGKRRSHDRVKKRQIAYCPQCSAAVPTHTICPKCGYYQGRTVVETAEE